MSGGSPLNNIPPQLLQLLIQRLLQQQGGGQGMMPQQNPMGGGMPQNPTPFQGGGQAPMQNAMGGAMPSTPTPLPQSMMPQAPAGGGPGTPGFNPYSLTGGAPGMGGGLNPTLAGAQALANQQSPRMPSMKKGGMVKKTGPHFLHKGERVVPAAKVSAKTKPKAVAARAPVKHASARHKPKGRK